MTESVSNIENQLNKKDLFDSFKRQLGKDFEQSNFSTDFIESLEPDYPRMLEKIATELMGSEKKTGLDLMQLLYRIDISEFQLRKYLQQYREENRFYVIAELIIKRVLQKVVVKQFYKNNIAPDT